jgi:phage terminase large subunit
MENPFHQFLDRYADDPVLFVREQFGVSPDPWQANVLRDIAAGERAISVRSGHGVGKSAVAAWALVWFLLTRFPCKAVVTAPTSSQLFDALFAEVKHWVGSLPVELQGLLDVKRDRIELKAAPESAFISARTSRAEQPEALQGIHSDNVLLIADEASGIPEAVYQAAGGSMSGESATTLLLGNPVRNSGLFADSHQKLAHRWKTYHVSCFDSPRVSKAYVDEQRSRYGEQSNVFRVRVLGEFPLADDDTIIPMEWVQAAVDSEATPSLSEPMVWGLDVARYGRNASVLVKRRGRYVYDDVRVWRGLNLMQLVGAVHAEYLGAHPLQRPLEIYVDSMGLGAGVSDRLRELGLPVRDVNVSVLPAAKDLYRNLRAELWYTARSWFEPMNVRIPRAANLEEDLAGQLAEVRYKYTSAGKLQAESKEEMMDRGIPSPDVADAFVLTFAGPAGRALYGSRGLRSRTEPIITPIPSCNV